jgi:hypothetical protein
MWIDEEEFTKEKAKQNLKLLGKIFFYTGAIVPYYNGLYWSLYVRIWHPFSWLFIIWVFVYRFWKALRNAVVQATEKISEDLAEIMPTEEKIKYNYYKTK